MSTTPWAPTTLYDYRGGDRISDLIMRRGQIQADRAARSGEIWGGAIQGVGQQIGSALQQRSQEQEKRTQTTALAKRDAAATSFIEAWDGKDPKTLLTGLTKIMGPGDGPKMAQGALAFQGLTEAADEKDLARLQKITSVVAKMPDPMLARFWPAIRQKAAPTIEKWLGIPADSLPEEFTPEVRQTINAMAEAWSGAKPEDEYTLSPGQQRRRGGQVIAENPAEPKADTRSLELQAADAKARGDVETYNRLLGVRKQMGQADDKPSAPGLSPTMESNIVNRLTTQWDKAVAPAQDLSRQARLMQTGIVAAERGDMAAGSQAVLVTFQKILDPTSVVRESEYARSAAGQALLARIQGSFEKLAEGGAGVPISELKKFARLAEEMVDNSMGDYVGAVKERIGKTADRYKIPRELIFEDYSVARPASVITQRNTDTGAYRHSVDGGKTWKPGKP